MELFDHQKEGIEFLKKNQKSILADEMGLGKTRQAIIALGDNEKGVLVVCPASLKINWKREIAMVYPEQKSVIVGSLSEPRTEGIKWFIINYDILEKKIDFLERIIDEKIVDSMILDEAHYIKGKSIRAAMIVGGRAKKMIDGEKKTINFPGLAEKMKSVYCLTGTPIMNRPIEMFNLLKAIGHILGKNRGFFAKRYCGAYVKTIIKRFGSVIRYIDETGATNLSELHDKMKDYILRRKKSEVLNLPEKIISVMNCELNQEWQKTYDNAWDMYLDFLSQNPIPERNIDNVIMARHLVEITKLKQVCSLSKIDRMIDDIGNAVEQGEKIIVFTQYTRTLERIAAGASEIKHNGKKIKVVTLSGQDKMDARQKSVDRFQNDEDVKVFVGNIKAGGVGLNLTAASIIMFADMEWSPEIHRQAEDRAHRIGQTGTVNVYYYIASGTIEDDIIDILNSKKNISDQILDGVETGGTSAQFEFLRKLATKTAVDNSLDL